MSEEQTIVPYVEMPIRQVPPLRYAEAARAGIKQIMMTTSGGLGDQVCAEPALRYAFKLFPQYEISLLTSFPDLYRHLPFKRVYKSGPNPNLKDSEWLTLHTNPIPGNLTRDFVTHHYTQCVDFSSLCAFQRQLEIKDKQIHLEGEISPFLSKMPEVVVHPGRHWQSKTFPKWWWDQVILKLSKTYLVAIVGKDVDAKTGTVDVEIPPGCMDLRNKLSIPQLITVLKETRAVMTNDSAPLHIAAAGGAYIFFVASCKHPEYLTHWRRGKWGWRMKSLERDGLWNYQDSTPVRREDLAIDVMDPEIMENLLPDPRDVKAEVFSVLH